MPSSTAPNEEPRAAERIAGIVARLDHLLPGQAPIGNFVHHNTLHGLQRLPFDEALQAAQKRYGVLTYLPEHEFRGLNQSGRISDEDIDARLRSLLGTTADTVLIEAGHRDVTLIDVHRIAMQYGTEAISPHRMRWERAELNVLERVQPDVPPTARRQMLISLRHHQCVDDGATPREEQFIPRLWNACLQALGLDHTELHPEELTDLSGEQAEALLLRHAPNTEADIPEPGADLVHAARAAVEREAEQRVALLLSGLAQRATCADLLWHLTGEDANAPVRAALIRQASAFLDEGVAAWTMPGRARGFYTAWREIFAHDPLPDLDGPSYRRDPGIGRLPDDATDAVIAELRALGLPEAQWEDYLARVALALPGWSGMFNWRSTHPDYPANTEAPASLVDLLAVRLILDRLACDGICRRAFGIAPNIPELERYLRSHLAEALVRLTLFEGELPDYLGDAARRLAEEGYRRPERNDRWQRLADLILTWRHGRSTPSASHSVHGSAWRLFRLMQHLGLTAGDVEALNRGQVERLLATLDGFPPMRRSHIWLEAYERHYRHEIFAALAANHGYAVDHRSRRPDVQAVFCMDDREESIRRHLEEIDPAIETLGAAGFFGIAMYWRGLDDANSTALCPIVVTPSHEVRERPRPGSESTYRKHRWSRALAGTISRLTFFELRRNLVSSMGTMLLLAPVFLANLIARTFFPGQHRHTLLGARTALLQPVPTVLDVTAERDAEHPSPGKPGRGFTDGEQAERVASFLRATGLVEGFAPLIALIGHGSSSENNPHLAAYDCGACSGRHGGPNARAFAAIANRREVREILSQRGIAIPDDTWFIGGEHDTCTDEIDLYDTADVPPLLRPALHRLRQQLQQAAGCSAHERCRRFASASPRLTPESARRHVAARAADFSQARPELGHATNAAAFIGRRSMSRGAFFDRRVFLISYDPTIDPDGAVLEGLLLAVGPVGAGINLEYYFSTVDNERFGCGTKVPHNPTGNLGVMEGAAGDLRTGLPRQMIEIHEPMRLLVVVEQTPAILTAIYERQSSLRELIGNSWVQLATIDPHTGAI
ncbi:MAG: DUF2309 domain-containing protein, partial [Methylotetracoccus sp.]